MRLNDADTATKNILYYIYNLIFNILFWIVNLN